MVVDIEAGHIKEGQVQGSDQFWLTDRQTLIKLDLVWSSPLCDWLIRLVGLRCWHNLANFDLQIPAQLRMLAPDSEDFLLGGRLQVYDTLVNATSP